MRSAAAPPIAVTVRPRCRDVSQILDDTVDVTASKDLAPPPKDSSSHSSYSSSSSSSDESSSPETEPSADSSAFTNVPNKIDKLLEAAALEAKAAPSASRFGWTSESGRMWEVSEERGHSRIEESLRNISPADRPFQPYSAALVNTLDEMQMLTPDALASGDSISPLQQVRSRPQGTYTLTVGRDLSETRHSHLPIGFVYR